MGSPSSPTFNFDSRLRAAYSEGAGIFRIVPAAVAQPTTVPELTSLLRAAKAAGLPVVPRGGGTGMSGGNVGEGVVLDLRALDDGAVHVDSLAGTAVTSAGATCAALVRTAALHGLRLPATPSSWRYATLGGMVASNAAGVRSFRYGSVRSWVEALTLVTADGERTVLERGKGANPVTPAVSRFEETVAPAIRAEAERIRTSWPMTRKNSCGYALDAWLRSGDLLDLVIGAEGTLGVITAIRWRLMPIPATRAGLRVAVADDAGLSTALARLADSSASAVEVLDRTFLGFVLETLPPEEQEVARQASAMLLIEFEGSAAEVQDAAAEWASRLEPLALDLRVAIDAHELDNLWEIRHAASPLLARLGEGLRSMQVIEDGCVPPARLAEYLGALRAIAARHGVQVVLFGHAGDANVHANLLVDIRQPGWEAQVRAVFDDASCAQIALGGTPAGEHGAGRLRAGLLPRVYGREIVGLFTAVKQAFDPEGMMNPGVILPAADARLTFKAAAQPGLPADIEAGLRDMERAGAWDRDRVALAAPGPAASSIRQP
ncbi:MAG TPA: FAD-binding oxidoreductase [Gemmatimonadales bacterium]